MKSKAALIFLNSLPILIMMGFIPLIQHEYVLTVIYSAIIINSFLIKKEKNEISIFFFGFFIMIIFEAIFIRTGVETFVQQGLFGIMPLWLPFLWGYSFVAMKRGIKILNL